MKIDVLTDGSVTCKIRNSTKTYGSLLEVPLPNNVNKLHVNCQVKGTDITDIVPIEDHFMEEMTVSGANIDALHQIVYTNLKRLYISDCVSTIDRLDLNGCTKLVELDVKESDIGKIPDIKECISLTKLKVDKCDLVDDTLSSVDLSRLSKLSYLSITDCNIGGELPDYIANLSKLDILILNGNKLIGTIPSSYSRMTRLYVLKLASNRLEGDISTTLGMSKLGFLELHHNQFIDQTTLSDLVMLPSLSEITIYGTDIGGKLPSVIVPPQTKRLGTIEIETDSSNRITALPKYWKTESSDRDTVYYSNIKV